MVIPDEDSVLTIRGDCLGSVPNVVEKGIGISYPIEKPTNRKGGYTDEETIPFLVTVITNQFVVLTLTKKATKMRKT